MVSSPDLEGFTNAPKSGNRLTKAGMSYRPMLRFRGCILGPLGPVAEEGGNGGTGQGTPPRAYLVDMLHRLLWLTLPLALGCQPSITSEGPVHESFGAAQSIVWLVCEDQGAFLSAYGDSVAHTPHLDRLANEGTVFHHMFSNAPVCAPSRSSIATGVLPTELGTHHMRAFKNNRGENNPHTGLPFYSPPSPEGASMFTEALRTKKIHCTNNAKEDYNFRTPLLAWDESSKWADWTSRPKGAKFFAVFNHFGTHESGIWSHAEKPCDLEATNIPLPPLLPEHPDVRGDVRTNYCNLERLDDWVGTMVNRLKQEGLYEQSMVVFFSDHGGPFPNYKRDLSDAGLHVPFIVKWPQNVGHPPTNDGLFSFVDLAPTMLHWLGVKGSPSHTGQVIRPNGHGHEAVLGTADRMDAQPGKRRSLRTKRWRLTRNTQLQRRTSGAYSESMASFRAMDSLAQAGAYPFHFLPEDLPEWQLYDVEKDPYLPLETNALKNHALVLDSLKQQLEKAFPPSKDWGRMSEESMLQAFWPQGNPDALDPPTMEIRGDQFALHHNDPSASLGWRLQLPVAENKAPDTTWQVVRQGQWSALPFSTDSLELVATRIGFLNGTAIHPLPVNP